MPSSNNIQSTLKTLGGIFAFVSSLGLWKYVEHLNEASFQKGRSEVIEEFAQERRKLIKENEAKVDKYIDLYVDCLDG